ncbi:hypothetical protein [Hydrotalea lipotrueae]|uniref:hypothetical protein n=1 Tax=Hydrotalea lipotrueae TaxID=2803817 RepID=UPI001C476A69|nr:hypothetical protein [Hydrotalea lipotrueae]
MLTQYTQNVKILFIIAIVFPIAAISQIDSSHNIEIERFLSKNLLHGEKIIQNFTKPGIITDSNRKYIRDTLFKPFMYLNNIAAFPSFIKNVDMAIVIDSIKKFLHYKGEVLQTDIKSKYGSWSSTSYFVLKNKIKNVHFIKESEYVFNGKNWFYPGLSWIFYIPIFFNNKYCAIQISAVYNDEETRNTITNLYILEKRNKHWVWIKN